MKKKCIARNILLLVMLLLTNISAVESDFNGDTLPDMLVKNTDNGRVTAWLNTPSGVVSQFIKTLPTDVELVATADINGDNYTDIITLNSSNGRVNAWVNTAVGTSTQYLKTLVTGVTIVGIADIDDDGNDDIIVQNTNNGRINAWLNTDAGTITQYLKTLATDVEIIAQGDFNGDDRPDILVHNTSNGRVNAWLNTVSGISSQYIKTLGSEVEILDVGDIDGNGWTDVVVQNISNGRVTAWLNTESGVTSQFIKTGTSNLETVAIADVDADGNDDIIVINTSNGRVNAWLNTASGTVSKYLKTLVTGMQIVGIGDANADEHADIIVENTNNGRVNAWLNTDGGTVSQYIKTLGSNLMVVSSFVDAEDTESIGEQIASRHNIYRNLEFDDSNVTWDDDLASQAQAWADYLAENYTKADYDAGTSPHASSFQVDLHTHDDYVEGENIAWGTNIEYLDSSPIDISIPGLASVGAVDLWANEKSYYDYVTNETTVEGESVGHYTQVVWQKTTKIGCGKASVQDADLGGSQIVCRYAPAGNYVGEKPYCTEYSVAPYYTDESLVFTAVIIDNNSFDNTKLIEDRTDCTTSELTTETLTFGADGTGTFYSFDFFNNGGYVTNYVFTSSIENGVLMMTGDVNGHNAVMSLNLIGQNDTYYFAEAIWSLDSEVSGYTRSGIFKLLK